MKRLGLLAAILAIIYFIFLSIKGMVTEKYLSSEIILMGSLLRKR